MLYNLFISFLQLSVPSPHIRILNLPLPRRTLCYRPTSLTSPLLFTPLKSIHRLLNLTPQIRTMKALLIDNLPTTLVRTVPPQRVNTVRRPRLLQHYAYCVREAHGIVWRVGWEKEHAAFGDENIFEFAAVDDFEEHCASILVEPFGGGVDVVVCSGIGTADNLWTKAISYEFGVEMFRDLP